jgi:hypothetical protein
MIDWNYDFYNGKTPISSADIEDFEAHMENQRETDDPDLIGKMEDV